MKKSLLALAVLGACAGVAQAQSSVTIYGNVDIGIKKTNAGTNGTTLDIGIRNNNRLGFRGVEDLGGGLKALFGLEIRFNPDTGTVEGGTTAAGVSRPLFQGNSFVGLQGEFGTVRLGRFLTAYQQVNIAFEPWSGIPGNAGFQTDLHVADFNTDPLNAANTSRNRISNAMYYATPMFGGGFEANLSIASKEAGGTGIAARNTPISFAGTYKNGPAGAMLAYERNALEAKLWSIGGYVMAMPKLKVIGSYQKQDQSATVAVNSRTKAWVIGANYTDGANLYRIGYGQKSPDNVIKTKQFSVGYEYAMSKRTYVYADISNKKRPVAPVSPVSTSFNFFGVGISHSF